jgi:hypothetical protein
MSSVSRPFSLRPEAMMRSFWIILYTLRGPSPAVLATVARKCGSDKSGWLQEISPQFQEGYRMEEGGKGSHYFHPYVLKLKGDNDEHFIEEDDGAQLTTFDK